MASTPTAIASETAVNRAVRDGVEFEVVKIDETPQARPGPSLESRRMRPFVPITRQVSRRFSESIRKNSH